MSEQHQIWSNEDRAEYRQAIGYSYVLDDGGQRIKRDAGVDVIQVLMQVPQSEYEIIRCPPTYYDTAYNSYIPKVGRPHSMKPEFLPTPLIGPWVQPEFYRWEFAKKHPLFAWVCPGQVFRGYTNWFCNRKFARLVIRSADWSLYIRIGWSPWHLDFVPESRQSFADKWK